MTLLGWFHVLVLPGCCKSCKAVAGAWDLVLSLTLVFACKGAGKQEQQACCLSLARRLLKSGKKAKQRKDAVIQIGVDMCKSHVLALEWQAWKQETIEVSIVVAAMN